MKEHVILVDEEDNQIGSMEKLAAHQGEHLHRAVSILIFNQQGDWLIHKRAETKYHSSGLWSNTCCTHPYIGEDNLTAANRRLNEEMGLTAPLKEIFEFKYTAKLDKGLTECEYDHVFVGFTDKKPVINKNEVSDYRYISLEDLEEEINKYPEKYTTWFKIIFNEIKEKMTEIIKK